MGKTHFSGPLVVGGKQLTANATIAKLSQTVSDPPTQEEVQAISTKVDAIITALINAGMVKSS